MHQLSGRTAVVTGAASGIGRAIVERFAAEDMQIVLADIEPDALAAATAELTDRGAAAIGVPTDVTDLASVEALLAAATEQFGDVHVLCNNAGVGPPAEPQLWLNTPNDWRWTFGVNVFGVANGLHVFLPHMVGHGEEGHVVNTSSPDGGIVAMPNAAVYASSKAAANHLTRNVAFDLGPRGIRVNAIAPGAIKTAALMSVLTPEIEKAMLRHTPLGRLGETRDIAHAALFLCSPASSWVSGQVLTVSGGGVQELD